MYVCVLFVEEKEDKGSLFPCMIEVKAKLESGSDSEEIAFVESLFEQKNFKDATRMYRYVKMVKLEKGGQRT